MTHSNEEEVGFLAKALAKLSQVTPPPTLKIMKKAKLSLAILIVVMVLTAFYGISKSHSSHQLMEAKSMTANSYTLTENLTALERMQREVNVKAEANKQPNYTSTPGGIKIGNPKAIRQHASSDQTIDAELATRMNAPTTFINVDEPVTNQARKNPELASNASMVAGKDSNSEFLNAKNSIDYVQAVALPHPDYTVAAGEFIPATLDVAMNSELPGMLNATTSHDVYSLTGNHILIPKGSRLLGQYLVNNIVPTQTRLLISWTRVQLPSGVVVTLNSPSADSLGRAGSDADVINRHLFERFSNAFLFSMLGATAATYGVNPADEYNSVAQYRMGIASSFQQTARDSFQQGQNIKSTLEKYQGAEINVFVARDLDFFNVAKR